ncbi:hypothetical protein D3875_18150 [Deinococcus cavernae]|uniref:Uncharacterized protein n=1 Tax=Deinococcus cavernae TaxID=2320857 RepID=A0A418VAN1_9DEIO|nr:hypothetical protein [Deinococcus cavernae]RJF73184.1 hypothetical protein D3875_18150 [Deinococcus cavernae]
MPLGDPPNYSTPKTLGLALSSLAGAMAHFLLGALEFSLVGPFVGLWQMFLAGFLLVFGVLTSIRYLEALDAMRDPHPRTRLYGTPHEWHTYRVGVSLHSLGALLCLYWLVHSELVFLYALTLLLNGVGVFLAFRSRPTAEE